MGNSRTKNSILTLATSGIRQVMTIVLTFLSRTVFIYVLGAEYLGLNGLFSNVLSILALSELGIAGAIAFYLYKPLVDKDIERIKVLMRFYRICYNVVGVVILVLGCAIIPFLHNLVNFEQSLPENLYLIYILFLLQNVASYFFFAYKQTLVSANQELYKIEKLNILFSVINCLTDIAVLLVFRDFILYLVFKLLLVIVKNVVIAVRIDKEYPYLKERCDGRLSKDEIRHFFKDLYSISIFKIGSVMLNALTNILISVMIGTIVVGYYSNYSLIVTQVNTIYMLLITSVTAGIGNVVAKESKERQIKIYEKLSLITYFVYSLFTIMLFQLLNSFIHIWVGRVDESYILHWSVVLFICMDFYINTSCQLDNVFRTASGNFQIGRYLQIVAGVLNLILAIILCKWWGLAGIFAAQVIAKMVTSYMPFMMNIEKTVFGFSYSKVFFTWLRQFAVIVGIAVVVWLVNMKLHQTTILNFVIEAIVTVAIFCAMFYLLFRKNVYYVEIKTEMVKKITKR